MAWIYHVLATARCMWFVARCPLPPLFEDCQQGMLEAKLQINGLER